MMDQLQTIAEMKTNKQTNKNTKNKHLRRNEKLMDYFPISVASYGCNFRSGVEVADWGIILSS